MRLVHLPDPVTVVVDVAAWALIHAGTGYLAHRVPSAWLARDRWLFRERAVEGGGHLYAGALRIGRWKDRLPEAGALFAGGISKRHLTGRDQGGLARFVVETRRAELAHWMAAAPGPAFALWNPPAVVPVMVLYGVLVNLPFVAVQRYNRIRASRVLRARAGRARAPRDSGSVAPTAPSAACSRRRRGTRGSSMP